VDGTIENPYSEGDQVRKWAKLSIVVLAVLLAAGLTYAQRGGHGGGGGRPGVHGPGIGPRGIPNPNNTNNQDLVYVEGVIKSVDADANKLTITARNNAGKEQELVLLTNRQTQVFNGEDRVKLEDLAVGSKVVVCFVPPKGDATPVAVLIRGVKGDKDTKADTKPETKKTTGTE
jgi:Cu/Ag efflux protein CusF